MNIFKSLTDTAFYESTGRQREWLRRKTSTRRFGFIYMFAGLGFLLLSTTFWALLGARVNQFNADQLADPMLFFSGATFKAAQFPGSHTFLLKWPLFFIIKVFGYNYWIFVALTVAIALVTVGFLALILYRIDNRRLVFGTLCIMLGSVLLLVPTVPKSGVLLPVNMAMLETRNLEYAVFIMSLFCLARAKRIRNWWFLTGVLLLGLLIGSDKLFLSISIGGALIALVVYALAHGWNVVSISVDWLVASIGAAASAAAIIWLISVLKITTIVSSGAAGPYAVVQSSKTAVLGAMYAITGIATNFGANPSLHALELTKTPGQAVRGLLSTAGPAYLINAAILLLCLWACVKLLRSSFAHNRNWRIRLDNPARVSLLLIYSALAACVVFIFSDHYYAGDARYLAIALFAGFVALATYLRERHISNNILAISGGLMVIFALLACISVFRAYQNDVLALAPINSRNELVSQALKHHNVDVLAGDYWRTVPTRVISDNRVNILPLANCTVPRDILTSSDWNKNLNKQSFAYLLSLDKGLTDFPTCSLQQVISNYGRPNSSLVIEGTLEKPKELLLFYDNGSHSSSPSVVTTVPSTVTPISLDELPNSTCANPTVMNIVAHEDDDLLFMNPDLYHNIQQGFCIRTVYITAGDAGGDKFYWLKREQGAQAAYDVMLASKQIWINRIVKLRDGAYITVSNPRNNPKISLIFLHLPDGNVHGQGFGSSSYANIERLENGSISKIYSIDGTSSYTSAELTAALAQLMARYIPAEINTQSGIAGTAYIDHSDHMTAGRFARKAYDKFEHEQFDNKVLIPFNYYMGYPIHERPENISGQELTEKTSIFLEYGTFDGGVCHSFAECSANPAYGAYLQRQYKVEK